MLITGATGAFLDVFASGMDARNLAFGPDGNLYVSSNIDDAVFRYDGATGAFVDVFASGGGLDGPAGLTFGPDGHLYVAGRFGSSGIFRFDGPTGAFIDEFVPGGSGGLSQAAGLEFGPDGALYVANRYSSEVLRFDPTTGAFIDSFASGGSYGPTDLIFVGQMVFTFDGGVGADGIHAVGDTDFTITDFALSSAAGGSIAIVNVEAAGLTGGAGDNRLDAAAFAGNVTLVGGAGNDTILGGSGAASLLGGIGDDSIVFETADTPTAVPGLIDGGAGVDELVIDGLGERVGSFTASDAATAGGTFNLGGASYLIAGAEAITITDFAEFVYVTPGSQDVVTIDQPVVGWGRIDGTSDGIALTPIQFVDTATVTLDTAANDGGSPDDAITIEAAGATARGLIGMSIVTGAGNDTVDVSSTLRTTNLPSGLIGYWPLNGDGADLSGAGRDLDLFGGVGFADGLLGQALDLRGDPTQYAGRPVDDDVFDFVRNDFTLQLWVNFHSTDSDQVLIEKFAGLSGDGWSLKKTSDDRFGIGLKNTFDGRIEIGADSSVQPVAIDQWRHLVVRSDGSSAEVLLDFRRITSYAYLNTWQTSTPLLIGSRGGLEMPVDGLIDEVAIWDRPLSDAEIAALFHDPTLSPVPIEVHGGAGIDRLTVELDSDLKIATVGMPNAEGADFLVSGIEEASLTGGASDNLLDASAFTGNATLIGKEGDDTLVGGSGDDSLVGGAGIDRIVESGDVDFTLTDSVLVGRGANVHSGIEEAVLTGGAGNNVIDASAFTGNVTLDGAAGNDTLIGGAGDDVITSGLGDDVVDGAAGIDRLVETEDADLTLDDTLLVGMESDLLASIEEAELTGGAGANVLDASAFTGDVTLVGGAGVDTLLGGAGDDVLIDGDAGEFFAGGGNDRITVYFSAGAAVGTVTVEGGAGTDELFVVGDGSVSGAYTLGSAGSTLVIGAVTVNSVDLASVTVAALGSLVLITPGSRDELLVDSPVAEQNRIGGTSDGVALTPVSFVDVQHVTIDTATNDATVPNDPASPDDAITLGAAGLVARGLETFTVMTGAGDDTFTTRSSSLRPGGRDFLVSTVSSSAYGILRYDGFTGEFLEVFVPGGSGGMRYPGYMELGPDGNLYVGAYSDGVYRYDGFSGAFLDHFVEAGPSIHGLTFGPDGDLYTTRGRGEGIAHYDGTTGALLEVWPDSIISDDDWGSLTFGPDGNLYVGVYSPYARDPEEGYVARFDGRTGALLDTFVGGLPYFDGMTFGPDGDLYLYTDEAVLRYDGTTGASLGEFTWHGMYDAGGLVFGPDGNLYLSGWGGGGVRRYDGTTGSWIDTFTSGGELSYPVGMAFGADRFILDGGAGADRVVVDVPGAGFTLTGDRLTSSAGGSIKLLGVEASALNGPNDILLDASKLTGDASLSGTAGDDTITIDFSAGIPAGTITVDGAGGFDSLVIIGGSAASGSYTPDVNITGNGTVTVGASTIDFVNFEPLIVSDLVEFTFITPGSQDVLLIDSPDDTHARISGTSDGVAFESLTFSRIPTFTLDAGRNDGAQADDVVTVDSTGVLASWLAEFTIETGDGDDTLEVLSPRLGGDPGLLVVSWGTNNVLRYDRTSGEFLGEFVSAGSGALEEPGVMAHGPGGDLYVGSYASDSVLRFDGATGAFIEEFVASGDGGLDQPEGILFGPDGHLYVSSYQTDVVLRYDGATGAFLDAFVPAASGGLDGPGGLAFGSEANCTSLACIRIASYATTARRGRSSTRSFPPPAVDWTLQVTWPSDRTVTSTSSLGLGASTTYCASTGRPGHFLTSSSSPAAVGWATPRGR